MVRGKNRIPYWIDRRLTGLAEPDYDATISFGLPIEPEDSQYGKYRVKSAGSAHSRGSVPAAGSAADSGVAGEVSALVISPLCRRAR